MPVSIHWEAGGVLLQFSGVVTLDDLHTTVQQLMHEARSDDIRYVICDLTQRQPDGPNGICDEENEVLAAFTAGIFQERNFIVADVVGDPIFRRLSEHYASLATHPFAVFSNVVDARKWIGDYLSKV